MTPMILIGCILLLRKLSAIIFGKKLCSRAYFFISSRFSTEMRGLSLSARETVATDTPRFCAISFIVMFVVPPINLFFILMQSRDFVTQIYTFSMKYLTYINLFVTQQSVQTFALAKLYFQREKSVKSLCPQLSLHPTKPIMWL